LAGYDEWHDRLMPLVLLRGGSRDGESTTVDETIERLLAASEAPGLIDIYEMTDEVAHVPGNDESAIVYAFVGQEPVTETPAANLHMPHTPGYA
jgi:hypothetical protein